MALASPIVVRVEKQPEGSFGETMNVIRFWLDHCKSNQSRSSQLALPDAVLGLRSPSTARLRRVFSSRPPTSVGLRPLTPADTACAGPRLMACSPSGVLREGSDVARLYGPPRPLAGRPNILMPGIVRVPPPPTVRVLPAAGTH